MEAKESSRFTEWYFSMMSTNDIRGCWLDISDELEVRSVEPLGLGVVDWIVGGVDIFLLNIDDISEVAVSCSPEARAD